MSRVWTTGGAQPQKTCPQCNGNRTVPDPDMEDKTATMDCPTCNGAGTVDK